ncbi:MAG: hypothetical protein ACI9W7_001068, partial [Porticoccaceae bacterium]
TSLIFNGLWYREALAQPIKNNVYFPDRNKFHPNSISEVLLRLDLTELAY